MAAIAPTITRTADDSIIVSWLTVTQADTFVAVGGSWMADYADRNVHIYGTIGAATVVVNGSNAADASGVVALTDPQGNAISKTSLPALEQITENTLFVQPTHSGGSGESVNVVMVCRRNRV